MFASRLGRVVALAGIVSGLGMIPDTTDATPLITAVAESGTALDSTSAHFTGQTFTHESEGANFTVPLLGEDVTAYTDRLHEYNGDTQGQLNMAQLGLVGAEYVMIANDNRGVADYRLDVSVSALVDVYVFMDTRVAQPAWLSANGFVDTRKNLGIDEGGDASGPGNGINNRFNIWHKANVPAGTFSTYERGGTGNNMYGVAVLPPGVGPVFEPPQTAPFTPGNVALLDIKPSTGRLEPNALAVGTAANNANGSNFPKTSFASPQGFNFSVTIDNLDQAGTAVGGIDWRDRGDGFAADPPYDNGLVKLAEDFIKNNAGVIRVSLSDLPAGLYNATSFHVDTDNTQCEAIRISVDVGDGRGFVDTGVTGTANVRWGGVDGLSMAEVVDNGRTFAFTADGLHDVLILFDGRAAADTELPLSGLNIQMVPEPTVPVLLGTLLGTLGLARLRRKRAGRSTG